MKKRLFAAALCAAMLTASAVSAEITENSVEVVTTDMDTGLASGEPYISGNGITMVPVRMIGELVGAEYDYDTESGTILVAKSDEVAIILNVGSSYADVNGYTTTLDEPPVISDAGFTMVPLRFLCENLGAEVAYEDGKVYVSAESTAEYDDTLAQKITNEYVGDSYYGWSMLNPRDMTAPEIYTPTKSLTFSGNGTLSINIEERPEGQDFETVFLKERYSASLSATIREVNRTEGEERFSILAEIGDAKVYYLFTASDKYYYEISAYATDGEIDSMRATADSFRVGYVGGDIYNFAQNRAKDYKKLENKDYKIEVMVPGPWELYDNSYDYYYGYSSDSGTFCTYSAISGDSSIMTIDIYSADEAATAQNILAAARESLIECNNPEKSTVSEITEYEKGVYFDAEDGESRLRMFAFEQDGYVYLVEVNLFIKTEEGEDIGYASDAGDFIMNNIKCGALNETEHGKMLYVPEPRDVTDVAKGEYIEFTYPIIWMLDDYSYDYYYTTDNSDYYSLERGNISLDISAQESYTPTTTSAFEESLRSFVDGPVLTTKIDNCKFLTYTHKDESETYEIYAMIRNGIIYSISLTYDESAENTAALQQAKDIINSIKIKNK